MSYPPGPDTGGPPRRGGKIVFVREEDPDYLDPALSYGTYTAPVIEVLFRTLLEYADAPGLAGTRLAPEIAESLPDVREGGTLYAFKIRKEARFGAPVGRRITAADFKYSIERLFRAGSPGVNFYQGIVGAKAMLAGTDTTLAGVIARGDSLYFRIERPDPIFLQILTLSFTAPVPREVVEKWPDEFSQHTVSTGPYRVAEFTPRRRVLMVRNPDYWGTPGWADTIEMRLSVATANAVALIRKGRVDGGFFEVPPGELARMRADPYWARQISMADGLNTEHLFMNVRVKPFNDVRVRQAVNWAIDRRAVVKAWAGRGEIAGEFLPHGMPGAAKLDRYLGPDRGADPEKARRLLREAGYPNGFKTRLYGWTTPPGPRELEVIQQQLARVGIVAELDLGEAAGYTSMAYDTTNRIAFGLYSWTADYLDPSNFFDPLLNGRHITPTNNLVLSMFDDPKVNALIERAMTTTDDSLRFRMWREVDARVMDLAPVCPLIHAYETRLFSPRVGGWYRHATRILKLDRLYVKQPSAAPLATSDGAADDGATTIAGTATTPAAATRGRRR